MDHWICLRSLREKGAHPHLVGLVAAFLFERKMTVRVGSEFSAPRTVNGGAAQGSLLGPYLFCIIGEILAEEVEQNERDLSSLSLISDVGELPPSPQLSVSSQEGDVRQNVRLIRVLRQRVGQSGGGVQLLLQAEKQPSG